jgi:nucleoside-diphosphate-sugar epimerase
VKVLVTGGAGFIGHHLVAALVERGDDVVVLDDFSTGRRDRVSDIGASRIIEGDLREGRELIEALDGRELVFHQAAIASVVRSIADPVTTNAVNVEGTIRLMVEAARAGVRRVIAASSSAVYGGTPRLPSSESERPEPMSPYATSKLAMEHYAHNLGAASGIETVALRYFNVFGPAQDPAAEYAAVVPRFITAVLGSHRPVIYGDGRQSRDFTYVGDVVAANLLAADRPGVSGRTLNIGSGQRHSLLDLLAAVGEATGEIVDPRFEDPRPGDVRDSQADISAASAMLGFRSSVSLAEGIQRSVAWYRRSAMELAVPRRSLP